MKNVIPNVEPWIMETELEAVTRVISRNWLTEGPESELFSSQLNDLIGVQYGVFAPNGTLALVLGLIALGVGPGDEVIVPNTTFIGSANAVILTGANPVFVDVEPENFQIDIDKIPSCITGRTKAIMPVHLFGSACDMNPIMELAEKYNLKVIEDAAQGIGVRYRDRHVGSIGDAGCFSFFADKTITTGEGGYVVCRDADVYEKLLYLRNQGRLERGSYIHPMIGYNFRITDLQAAIGLEQLKRLPEIISRKNILHGIYSERLANVPEIRILGAGNASCFVPFRLVLIAERKEELMNFLKNAGVETRTFFYPLNQQPCYQEWSGNRDSQSHSLQDYSVSKYCYEHGILLPIYPKMEKYQVDYISDRIVEFFKRDFK